MSGDAWPEIPLAEVLDRLEVGIASVGPETPPGNGEWGVIRLGAVTSGKFVPGQAKRLPDSVAPRPSLEISQGDVLLVRVNGSPDLVGSICIVARTPPRLMLSDLVMRLVPNPGVMDSAFLGMVLSSRHVRRQIVTKFRGTSGQFQLPQSELKSVLIRCPPTSEQRRIVDVLDSVTAMERRIEASIAKLRDVRRGALQASMESLAREKPAAGWARMPLKDVVPSAEYGVSEALDKDARGVPVLRMNNIQGGRVDVDELRYCPVPVPAKLFLRCGDVLFNRTNSMEHIGKAAMWRDELSSATFASYLVRLIPDLQRVIPEYLVEWLMHPLVRQRVRSISTVAVQQVNVNPSRLRELEIDLPTDLAEQRRIVAALEACDEQIGRENEELNKLRELKQGIVDDLLSGRVEVSAVAV
jgi:type I restriction enzyme, S subunit